MDEQRSNQIMKAMTATMSKAQNGSVKYFMWDGSNMLSLARNARRTNNIGYVGFICENAEELKKNVVKLSNVHLNIYKLENSEQYYVETHNRDNILHITREIHSSSFFINRETLTAQMYIDQNSIVKKDRTIYLVDSSEQNASNPIFKPILLKSRLVEDYCFDDMKIDITKPMTKKEIVEKKVVKFSKIMFLNKPVKRKLTETEIEELKKAGEYKRQERASTRSSIEV